MASGYEPYVWGYFKSRIGNEYGVAGLMGNLKAESGMYPNRVQGDIPYSSVSIEYTRKVDNGSISENDFVHNGPGGGGYGLAQWTFYTRKQALYDMYKSGNYSSIGCIELACDYLYYELVNSYAGVLKVLRTATSVRQASDSVLHDFEKPANQSVSNEVARAKLGQAFYDEFKGTSGNLNFSENDRIIMDAIAWAVSIAEDDTHGYDQGDRWGPDYDCSSLVISAFEKAGCPVKTNGASTTRDMREVFIESGFIEMDYVEGMELVRGDVLWKEGHTEMYIGDGKDVGAHVNELGSATGGATGDQTGKEINVSKHTASDGWLYVLRLPSSGALYTIKKGLSKLLLFAIATDRF